MAIELNHITKRFGETTALEDISVTFGENRIYGLLGRNGAGKTTLLGLITNRIFPTEGQVLVDGEPVRENDRALGRIFCMSEKDYYPDGMSIKDLFRWTRYFYPCFRQERAQALAKKFGLELKGKYKDLSTGYRSICKLILAMSSGADYLLFDEPVLGLDAHHRELFYRELLADYGDEPRTILLSTHLIDEVAGVVEQLVVLKKGRLQLDCPTDEALRMGYTVSGKAVDVDRYCQGRQVLGMEQIGGLKTASLYGERQEIPPELECIPLELQRLFVKLTGEETE